VSNSGCYLTKVARIAGLRSWFWFGSRSDDDARFVAIDWLIYSQNGRLSLAYAPSVTQLSQPLVMLAIPQHFYQAYCC